MTNNKENLRVSCLVYKYDKVHIIDCLDLVLKKGEVSLIYGDNGSGKTTLINLLSGFLKPQTGDIFFDGNKQEYFSPGSAFKMGISRTFQDPVVFDQLPVSDSLIVAENARKKIPLWNDLASTIKKRHYGRADTLYFGYLDCCGLIGKESVNSEELSYGQRKLLGFLQALLTIPKILLLDEPIAGVDNEQTTLINELLKEWLQKNSEASVMIISHETTPFNGIIDCSYKLMNGRLERC